jgi:hypothetical protein
LSPAALFHAPVELAAASAGWGSASFWLRDFSLKRYLEKRLLSQSLFDELEILDGKPHDELHHNDRGVYGTRSCNC